MSKRTKVLLLTIRRALLMIAEGIKMYCSDVGEPEIVPD